MAYGFGGLWRYIGYSRVVILKLVLLKFEFVVFVFKFIVIVKFVVLKLIIELFVQLVWRCAAGDQNRRG